MRAALNASCALLVVIQAQGNLHAVCVWQGRGPLKLAPDPRNNAIDVLPGNSVQGERLCASTADLATIRTELWLVLLAPQELLPLVLAVQASMSVPRVRLGRMLQRETRNALRAVLGGMPNHVGRNAVLPVWLVSI